MIYSEKLKFLREEKEITQNELANLLQIHSATYSQFEREYTIIPIKKLSILADFFHVSIDYLFDFKSIKQYTNTKKEVDLKISGKRLKTFRKENRITQKALAQFLNTTQSNIVGYEQGKFIIATPYLYMICQKYNISADYLLGKIDNSKYLK